MKMESVLPAVSESSGITSCKYGTLGGGAVHEKKVRSKKQLTK